jgi:hypothetical protein
MIMTTKPIDFSYRDYRTFWDASLNPKDYFRGSGYAVINVLPELIGKPWDKRALAFVMSMKPRCIRVTDTDMVSADATTDRITVYLYDTGTIRLIEKEISLWLDDEWDHGADAEKYLRSK